MKIRKIEKIQNSASYCMKVDKFENFLVPIKNDKFIVSHNCFSINVPSRWGCVDLDTYVKGERGWLHHDDVHEGDLVCVIDVKTGSKSLLPVKKVIEKTATEFVRIKGTGGYEQVVTPEHRVLVVHEDGWLGFEPASSVTPGQTLPTADWADDGSIAVVLKTERFEKTADVWCVNTDAGTAFYSRNWREFLSGNSQAPFSNITLDLGVPNDLKKKRPIIGGEKMKFTYGECQEEANRIAMELFKLFEEGDATGNIFQYPIPTINVSKKFDWDSPVVDQIMKVTAKYGVPYFSNFVNSDLNPEDIRSMCIKPSEKVRIKTKEPWCKVTYDDGTVEYVKESSL